jgi:leucyl/phenylalanyl-tRNA--protein transferase
VLLGRCFFGESMFSRQTDASKVALVALVELLQEQGIALIDCQVASAHLRRLGGVEIPRAEFLRRHREAIAYPTRPEPWTLPDPPRTA